MNCSLSERDEDAAHARHDLPKLDIGRGSRRGYKGISYALNECPSRRTRTPLAEEGVTFRLKQLRAATSCYWR